MGKNVLIIVLIGVIGVLFSYIVVSNQSQTLASTGGAASGGVIGVTGITLLKDDILYCIDTNRKRILLYQARAYTKRDPQLKLLSVRDYTYELELKEYNSPRKRAKKAYEKMKKAEMKKRGLKGKVEPPAPSSKDERVIAVTGKNLNVNQDLLYVIDAKRKKVLVYAYGLTRKGDQLDLLSVRDYAYDLELQEYNNERPPSIEEVKEFIRKEKLKQRK